METTHTHDLRSTSHAPTTPFLMKNTPSMSPPSPAITSVCCITAMAQPSDPSPSRPKSLMAKVAKKVKRSAMRSLSFLHPMRGSSTKSATHNPKVNPSAQDTLESLASHQHQMTQTASSTQPIRAKTSRTSLRRPGRLFLHPLDVGKGICHFVPEPLFRHNYIASPSSSGASSPVTDSRSSLSKTTSSPATSVSDWDEAGSIITRSVGQDDALRDLPFAAVGNTLLDRYFLDTRVLQAIEEREGEGDHVQEVELEPEASNPKLERAQQHIADLVGDNKDLTKQNAELSEALAEAVQNLDDAKEESRNRMNNTIRNLNIEKKNARALQNELNGLSKTTERLTRQVEGKDFRIQEMQIQMNHHWEVEVPQWAQHSQAQGNRIAHLDEYVARLQQEIIGYRTANRDQSLIALYTTISRLEQENRDLRQKTHEQQRTWNDAWRGFLDGPTPFSQRLQHGNQSGDHNQSDGLLQQHNEEAEQNGPQSPSRAPRRPNRRINFLQRRAAY